MRCHMSGTYECSWAHWRASYPRACSRETSSLLPDAQGPTTAIRPGTLSGILRTSSLLVSVLQGDYPWNRKAGRKAPNPVAGGVRPDRHHQHAHIIARPASLDP